MSWFEQLLQHCMDLVLTVHGSLCRQAKPGSCGHDALLSFQHRDANHVTWLHCNMCTDTHAHWRSVLPGLGPALKAQQGI